MNRLLLVGLLGVLLVDVSGAQTPIGRTSTEDPPTKIGGAPFGGYITNGLPQCPVGKTATLWGYQEEGNEWAAIYQCV